ncbi:MAG: VWA domain-containing protein [Fibrobacter sp.]|nr:VWA domain-containing protein [Fibrobacter sp.]
MKTKFLPILTTAFVLLCAACSDDNTSNAVADDHGSPVSGTETVNTFETPGTGSEYSEGIYDEVYTTADRSGAIYDMADAPMLDSYKAAVEPTVPPAGIEYEEGGWGWGGESNERMSGLLTAGEWNDLDNWGSWVATLDSNTYNTMPGYWKFFPNKLVAVKVVDASETALANVSVELLNDDKVEFATKTDNSGLAYCWVSLFSDNAQTTGAEDFSLKVNGKVSEEAVKITGKDDETINVNVITSDAPKAQATADIAFIVDATGSMGDEIDFLKSDLEYIIDHAGSGNDAKLRTAALFYRDESDVYITRGENFASDVSTTREYISKQSANGGGDYPEAVHSAFESALQDLSWNESARARIAFLILDAPAHHEGAVIESLQKSIKEFAKNGIKIIPVAASGVDKDTEFMLRFFEVSTGGTYVFITNDSGIGFEHIEASVGDHEVEKLADLMIRLIQKYVE